MDGLVKKAYDNWMHVIEYDGKSLLGFKQNQNSVASQSDSTLGPQDYSISFDSQVALPSFSAAIPQQHSMNPVLTVGGKNYVQLKNNVEGEGQKELGRIIC